MKILFEKQARRAQHLFVSTHLNRLNVATAMSCVIFAYICQKSICAEWT